MSETPTSPSESLPDTSSDSSGSTLRLVDVVRGIAATALLGSAVIHFAYAPAHFDEETSHGAFFVAMGWIQLALAVALALRARPPRGFLGLTAVANAGIIGVWVLSRTAGVPGSDAESVGFPDLLATGLEIVAVLAAAALLLGIVADRAISPRPAFGVVGAGAVAAAVLVSMSVTPSIAGEHDHAEADHGDEATAADHGHSEGEHAAMQAGEEDDWNETRRAALTGYLPEDEVSRIRQVSWDYLAEQLRARSRTLKELPEAEREERITTFVDWVVNNALEAENGEHGADGGHSHGPAPWQPITDPAEQLALQDELERAGQLIAQFPTAAEAMAGGYFQVTPWVPGIATHYINPTLIDDKFEVDRPEMLLYNGHDPSSELVGLSYATIGEEPPEGFTGENDTWHNHPSLCMVGGLVVGPDHTPDELCESVGGRKNRRDEDEPSLWMGHLWQVDGWESEWGIFSGENPTINMATTDLAKQVLASG